MAGATVSINIKAIAQQAIAEIDKVKAQLGALTTSKGFQSAVLGVGVGAGVGAYNAVTAAIRGMGDTLIDSVKEAANEQAGIDRLTAALHANVPAWDGNMAAIESVIQKRRELAFSDDDLRQSFGSIVAATHDVSKALSVQQTAMDLARFKGISLGEASDALVKVEGGQYRMLKSLGIVLADGATQTEALAAVQAVAAGQADAYANSAAGSFAKLDDAIKELKESIGAKLLPIVKPMIDALTMLADSGILVPAIALVASAIMVSLVPALAAAATQATIATGGLNLIIPAAVALGVAGYGVATSIGAMTDKVGVSAPQFGAMAMAGQAAAAGVSRVSEAASIAADDIHEMNRSVLLSQIVWPQTRKAVVDAALAMATRVRTSLSDLAMRFRTGGAEAANGYAEALLSGREKVSGAVQKLIEAMKNPLTAGQRLAYLGGILNGKQLAAGLKSSDPVVRAAAVAEQAAILEEVDALTGGMYTAGVNAANALANGLQKRLRQFGETTGGDSTMAQFKPLIDAANRIKALLAKGTSGTNPYAPITAGASATTAAADKVKSAFEKMKRAGSDYYDSLHRKTLQSIDDARKELNARYDAQISALNGQVSAAREALDAQRTAREQSRLQDAVANATTDQERVDAQQALDDFLAEQQVRSLEKSVATQVDALQAQRDSDNAKLDALKNAVDERYNTEKTGFDNLATLTNTSLATLEKRWADYAANVLKSLKTIGMGPSDTKTVEGKAIGGAVSAGAPYLVGERGPELFVPGASGAIVPNGALSGGGNVSVNVSLSGAAVFDPYGTAAQQVATALLPGLKRALTASGMSLA